MLPNSTQASVQIASTHPKSSAATFVLVGGKPPVSLGDDAKLPAEVRAGLRLLGKAWTGKQGEISSTVLEVGGKPHHVYAVGIGPGGKLSAEEARKVGGAILRAASKARHPDVAVLIPDPRLDPQPQASAAAATRAGPDSNSARTGDEKPPEKAPVTTQADLAAAIATGALLASFTYTEYAGTRKAPDLKEQVGVRLNLLAPSDAAPAVDRARTIALSTNFARTIASRPGNDINPVTLAKVAATLAKDRGLKLTVLDEKKLARLRMGGILGVGSGSATPPRLIVLEHKPTRARNAGKPFLIVGKTITFDTGGISIKPAEKMGRMIYDKSGGMAVLGIMHALAQLKTPLHVVGILAAAENHVSADSYRPGDILRMHNGVTVEVTNTDAEGRLVLGDAISWGIQRYHPQAVIDLATLTGGCVVALGTSTAGLFSNHDALAAELISAGKAEGEAMWRLPVGDEHRELLKSDQADVVNSAGRWGSALTAAAFISLFVPTDGSVPWAHLDIAGVADSEKDLPYLRRGATGYGVRTVLAWLQSKL